MNNSQKNNLFRRLIKILSFISISILSLGAVAQNFTTPFTVFDEEIVDRYKNLYKETVSGESYNPADGSVLFQVTDISIPGNFDLPVELTRWIPVEDLDTSGPSGWSWNIPLIRGDYMQNGYNGIAMYSDFSGGWTDGKNCSETHSGERSFGHRFDGYNYTIKVMDYWSGKLLHIPNQTSEKFLIRSGGYASPKNQATKSNFYVDSCIVNSSGEEGFIVKGPDGKIYTFNQVKTYFSRGGSQPSWTPVSQKTKLLMISRVEDRFGNFVDYNYDSYGNLTSIVASDDRRIDIYYEAYSRNGTVDYRATHAEANGKRWSYIYSAYQPAYGRSALKEVVLPDNTAWKYDDKILNFLRSSQSYSSVTFEQKKINGKDYYLGCHKKSPGTNSNSFSTVVKTPTGQSVEYAFRITYHGREQVNPQAYGRFVPAVHGGMGGSYILYHLRNLSCNITNSLVSKSISGPGLDSQLWTYSYSQNMGSYVSTDSLNQFTTGSTGIYVPSYGLPANIPNNLSVRTTTVSGPDSKITYYIDRVFQSPTEGSILAEDHLSASNSLLKRLEYSFNRDVYVGKHWFVFSGTSGAPTEDSLNGSLLQYRVNKVKEVTKQYYGSGTDIFTTDYQSYDNLGYLLSTAESNNFSSNRRYTKYAYIHDLNHWILGVPTTQQLSANGSTYTTVNETTYHGIATNLYPNLYLPYENLSYGTWTYRSPEFHTDGNVRKVEANEPLRTSAGSPNHSLFRYQLLNDYKRGKAQTVQVPQRYSTTATMQFSRIVNDDGWVTRVTDLNGTTAHYGYDDVGRLTSVDLPSPWLDSFIEWQEGDGITTKRLSHSCILNSSRSGCLSGSTTMTSKSEFDAQYRILSSHDEDVVNGYDRYQGFSFDSRHQPTFTSFKSLSASENNGTSHTYDFLGRVIRTALSHSGYMVTEYLPSNKVRVTDAEGHQTTTTYLAYGSPEQTIPVSIESPEGVNTRQVVNIFGKITSITQSGPGKNGSGSVTQNERRAYDAQQHLCKITRQDVGVTVFSNNVLGEIQSHAQGVNGGSALNCTSNATSAQQVITQYDNLGSTRRVTYPASGSYPGVDRIFNLDNIGNILSLQAGSVTNTYTYNILGKITSERLLVDGKTFSLGYGYNPAGYVSSLTYPDGDVVNFSPNAFGEAQQAVRQSSSGRSQFNYATKASYHPNGMISTFTYGNNLVHRTSLNERQMPQRIEDYRTGLRALDYSYSYNNNLKIIAINDHVNSSFSLSNLAYDGLGRLTSTIGGAGVGSSEMRYDGLGNITYYKNKKHTLDYSYAGNNRLLSVASSGAQSRPYTSFTYDTRGNVTNNSYHSFTYNLADQMVVSGSNRYIYDGHNRRVVAKEGVTNNYSFYSRNGQLLYREGPEGAVNYIYLNKKLIAKDGVIPQNSGKQHYLPFGGSVEGEKNDVGYTGHKFDTALNLSYMQARYYDPVIGRFYSNDPVGFTTQDISSFNRYSYVGNDPFNAIDPTGKFGQGFESAFNGNFNPLYGVVARQTHTPQTVRNIVVSQGEGAASTLNAGALAADAVAAAAAVTGQPHIAALAKGVSMVTGSLGTSIQAVVDGEDPRKAIVIDAVAGTVANKTVGTIAKVAVELGANKVATTVASSAAEVGVKSSVQENLKDLSKAVEACKLKGNSC